MLPGENWKFEVFKLLEMHCSCQSYHHHVIFVSFKIFTISSGGPFGSWGGGGGGACAR